MSATLQVLLRNFEQAAVGAGVIVYIRPIGDGTDREFVARLVNAGVRRRKLKFGGIMYHLWHAERPRDALDANDELLRTVREAGAVWAEDGMDKYGMTG